MRSLKKLLPLNDTFHNRSQKKAQTKPVKVLQENQGTAQDQKTAKTKKPRKKERKTEDRVI